MRDYTKLDLSGLSQREVMEYALADDDFGKTPFEYFQYIAVEVDALENIQDATENEVGQAFKAIAEYCLTGRIPDYQSFTSSGVKMLVRSIIHAHEKRMESEYVRHYRQYVSVQQKKQEKANGK